MSWISNIDVHVTAVIFFTFFGLVPVPVELGKIAAFFHKLGKIVNLNSEEIW